MVNEEAGIMVIQGSAEPVRRGKEGRITQPSNVVRRPPTRFPSNPLKIRVTFVPTIQFYQKDPRNKKGKRILLGPMASLTSVRLEFKRMKSSCARLLWLFGRLVYLELP